MSGPADAGESIGDVVRGLLRQPRLRRGLALGRLAALWGSVVGDPLARVTAPRALEGGVLVVGAETSAWAAQVSFLADEIRRRANEALGSEDVSVVRVTVGLSDRERLRRNAFGPPRDRR